MWEMRIVQLGFDQRAPTGCLQYFQGSNGTLKSFNFLSNGRFLASQDYLLCVRQERGMCGISYAPCSPDSFRIGLRGTQLANSTTPNANSNSSVGNDAGSLNGTNVEMEGSGSNPMDEGGTSMNTSSSTEQEVGPSNGAVYGQERCRDRVLIPCDFEEFITVMFLACLRKAGWLRGRVGMGSSSTCAYESELMFRFVDLEYRLRRKYVICNRIMIYEYVIMYDV